MWSYSLVDVSISKQWIYGDTANCKYHEKSEKTTVSEIVNTLEKNGYLKKFRSTEDKRIYCVKTTEEADRIKPIIEEVMQNLYKDTVANVPEQDLSTLVKVVSQFLDNLDDE